VWLRPWSSSSVSHGGRSWFPRSPQRSADPATSAADRSAGADQFTWINTVLGQGLGEAGGYVLTAAWTALVLVALRQRFAVPPMFAVVGLVSAVLILSGLLVPLGVPGADSANFAGFLLWTAWIVWFGVLLLRGSLRAPAMPSTPAPPQPLPA
jgi:hypothetical protein